MVRLRKHRLDVVLAVTALIALLSLCSTGVGERFGCRSFAFKTNTGCDRGSAKSGSDHARWAAGSYEVSGGEPCPSRRVAAAAFVKAGQGYLLQIRSDAPNRCDASTLPETAPIFDSLRLP